MGILAGVMAALAIGLIVGLVNGSRGNEDAFVWWFAIAVAAVLIALGMGIALER